MLSDIISSIVCMEFERQFPERHQNEKTLPMAMLLSFSASIDYNNEAGYRQADLVIYAHTNYIFVGERARWNVIPLEDLTDDDDPYVKPGKAYTKGVGDWKRLSYHDSCWREDGVRKFFFNNRNDISTLDYGTCGFNNWNRVLPARELSDDGFKSLINT